MAALREESVVYKTLSDAYDEKAEIDISEAFFADCVSLALEFSKREIQFALFKLKWLEKGSDSGSEKIDTILNGGQKILDVITGKNVKRLFIITILEAALEEK